MNRKDIVSVYEDPITKTRKEGSAELIEQVRPDEGDGLSMWLVHFLGDDLDARVIRTIKEG